MCCGAGGGVLANKRELSMEIIRTKLRYIKEAGADCIVTTCPSCQISFDTLQPSIAKHFEDKHNLPVLYYPQLLGLAMNMSPEEVGLHLNRVPTESILRFIKEKQVETTI